MQNAVLMDGGESRGFTSGGQAYSVPLESVAEFKIETAHVLVRVRPRRRRRGQCRHQERHEQYHGVLYEFLRNDHLNANSWSNNRNRRFASAFHPQRVWRRRGRTASFVTARSSSRNYEGVRVRAARISFLPPFRLPNRRPAISRERSISQGRQIMVYDYLTTRADPNNPGKYIRDAVPRQSDSGRPHSPHLEKCLELLARSQPRRGGSGQTSATTSSSGKNINPADIWFARIDHQISSKHRLFGRTGGAQNDSYSTLAEASISRRRRSTPIRPAQG